MQNFIDKLAPIAQKHGHAAHVLPSLIISQGFLESDSGKSELGSKANNLFGIKKGSGWNGEVYAKETKEWSKEKGWYTIIAEFRKYDSYEQCVIDLLKKYTNGLSWEKQNRYAKVINQPDYRLAAKALLEAGYATDPNYPEKLIGIIESHGLTKYDNISQGVVQVSKASNYLIALDDGHGSQTAGKRTPYIASLGRQIKENEFNKPVVNYLEAELKKCGFKTIQLAPTDADTPLTTRTNTANNARADILVSLHFNAMGNTFEYSSAKGFSVHIQEGMSNTSNAYKLAKLMIDELAKGTKQTNRGIVKQNLHMTRASAMPAVLVECGFMDDPEEALLMLNKNFQQEVAKELAIAICKYFGVSYVGNVSEVKPASNPTAKKDYLIYGDRNEDVSALQRYLTQVGYPVDVHGYYNADTKRAVMAFQKARGLKDDGIYGASSKAEMNKALKEKKPASPTKTEPKKEGVRMFKPSKDVLNRELISLLEKAKEDGIVSSDEWKNLAQKGQLPLDDAVGLLASYLNRTHK